MNSVRNRKQPRTLFPQIQTQVQDIKLANTSDPELKTEASLFDSALQVFLLVIGLILLCKVAESYPAYIKILHENMNSFSSIKVCPQDNEISNRTDK